MAKPRILIANRGEIAVRIIRTIKELGHTSIAVYSDADRDALHVEMADQAYRIGPALAAESYLSIGSIMEAASKAKATAVHPGYGFLSERSQFARAVAQAGLTFIGPPPEAIEMMGDKAAARQAADRVGVPIVPGTTDPVTLADATAEAERIGLPIIVKAAFGGGGRGMHLVRKPEELENALARAAREAQAYFGRPEVFLERYIDRAHHVEAQIMADAHGNVFFLGERDCSVQRRHQKLVEETPSPVVDAELRQRIGEVSMALAKEAGYVNAGTVEGLVDEDGAFYFLEMNTRLQVEHTVTEMVTGLDLVELQIRAAFGEKLDLSKVQPRGHAIQCRINAEDPARNFLPGSRPRDRLPRARRAVRPGGFVRAGGPGDPLGLRLHVREAHRLGGDPSPRDQAHAPCARRVPRGGRADDDPAPPMDLADARLHQVVAHHHVAREGVARCRARGPDGRRRATIRGGREAARARRARSSRSTAAASRCGSSTIVTTRRRARRAGRAPVTTRPSTAW